MKARVGLTRQLSQKEWATPMRLKCQFALTAGLVVPVPGTKLALGRGTLLNLLISLISAVCYEHSLHGSALKRRAFSTHPTPVSPTFGILTTCGGMTQFVQDFAHFSLRIFI